MKCPNCGKEMTDGTLYCEHCGEDIHIVPDFEPELEQNIQQTINDILEDIGQNAGAEKNAADGKKRSGFRQKKKSHMWQLLTALAVLIFVAAIGMAIWVYRYNSEEYQVSKAIECTSSGAYEKAIACYNRALALDEGNIELQFSLAEVYLLKNNKIEYEYLLRNITGNENASLEQLDRAYGKLIAIYRARGDYKTINELLMNSNNEQILTTYQNYIARMPEFSVKEGYYTSIQILKLSALGTGKIYYTTDGSEPDENSEQYTAPIILEDGDYLIKAVFINDNGIVSEVSTKEYHIDNDVIPAPEVSVISGEYNYPINIEILEDEGEVYYTTDGTVPTYSSQLYTGPIPMPLGKSTYKFARIVDGVTGEVAERSYQLVLNTEYTPEQAVAAVIQYSMMSGKIRDETGHFDDTDAAYKYEYQYVTNVKDVGDFYVVSEILRGADGSLTKTGTNFAVNIYSGERFKIERDSFNRIVLIEIEIKEDSQRGE
ncbi:MAG: chitobiase/beta-hexosaminidase C-terminal domain-containing protein [Acetatifactor sp.]